MGLPTAKSQGLEFYRSWGWGWGVFTMCKQEAETERLA